jgi:hypothetical protein
MWIGGRLNTGRADARARRCASYGRGDSAVGEHDPRPGRAASGHGPEPLEHRAGVRLHSPNAALPTDGLLTARALGSWRVFEERHLPRVDVDHLGLVIAGNLETNRGSFVESIEELVWALYYLALLAVGKEDDGWHRTRPLPRWSVATECPRRARAHRPSVAIPANDIDEALHIFCEVLGVEKRKDLIGTDRYAGPRRLGVDDPRRLSSLLRVCVGARVHATQKSQASSTRRRTVMIGHRAGSASRGRGRARR